MAAVLIICNLFINAMSVNAASVNDLGKSSNYAREAIQWMSSNNIISGDKQGNFNPVKTISRIELVTLMVKALKIDMSNLPTKATFTDVPTNHWSFKYVEAAYRVGVVSGIGNGKFGINNLSTREQITTMLMNYLSVSKEAVLSDLGLSEIEKYKDESNMSDWSKPSIQFAVYNNLMSGISADTFSPKGSATKEQIAVILYKFLNSRDSIQQNADMLKKPIVTFNGDIMKLSTSPEIVNGELLVPLELFKKIGAIVTTDEQMNKVIIKSSTLTGRNIYMNTGNQVAYTNYAGSGDPFTDSSALDKLINFKNAPKIVGNEVLVPVNAVVDAIGIQVEWNTKTNLVTINDSAVEKNPMLYNAWKNTLQYKGEYSNSMVMSMIEKTSNEEFKISFTMKGAVNDLNSTSLSNILVSTTGNPDEEYKYDTVNLNNKIYSKDAVTGEWSVLDPADATEQGIMYFDIAADRKETLKLLDTYNELKITPLGKAIHNGEEVSKYQIKISNDILEGFIPAEMLESGLGLSDIYNQGLDIKTEIYINSEGKLVKQSVKMTGGIEEAGVIVDIAINVDVEFSNIDKEIEIVSPI